MSDTVMRLHDGVTMGDGARATVSVFDHTALFGLRWLRGECMFCFNNAAEVRAVAALLIRAAEAMEKDA